jgi:hypothetical protein
MEDMTMQEVDRILKQQGFELQTTTRAGSKWRTPNGRSLFIPIPIPRKFFDEILRRENLTFDENVAEINENLAETQRILKESEKNKEAIDAWLNRRLQHQDR